MITPDDLYVKVIAMDILNLGSKQRNRWHKTAWTFRNPRIKESAKPHPSDIIITFILRLKTQVKGHLTPFCACATV